MSSAYTPILVGVVSPVSEIKLAYGPLKWKILIDRNRLKKFMQVEIDVKCMHTDFGGCDPSGFGDMATFQKRPNFPFNPFQSFLRLALFTSGFVYVWLCLPLALFTFGFVYIWLCLRLALFTSGFVYVWLCLRLALFTSGFVYLWLCLRLALFTSGFVYLWLCLRLALFTSGFVYVWLCLPLALFTFCPWSSKNLINWNRLKKFMQVDIDVTCMYTNFGGRVLFGFGDIATIKNSQISLSDLSKNLIDRNQLKKFMQVDIDVTCLFTDFGGRVIFGFGDTTTLKNDQISLSDHPWSSKNLINRNWPKKFMQVGIDVKFMHTKFGGCDLSGFGDIATFKNGQISLLTHGL